MRSTTARRPRLGLGIPRRLGPRRGVPWLRIDPAMAGYPWEAAGLHPANFPTPGLFWDADEPTQWLEAPHFDEVVRAALGSALLMADGDPELSMSRTSQARRLRQQLRHLIIEAPHNDVLYGCTNANYCGGADPQLPGADGKGRQDLHVLGPSGRGINWLARHAHDRERIAQGLAPARATNRDGDPLLEDVHGARPLIWIPALNLAALADKNPRVTTQDMQWSDGSSTLEVPPPVRALGRLKDVREGGT